MTSCTHSLAEHIPCTECLLESLVAVNKVSPPRGRQDDMPLADGSSTVTHRFAASQATMDPKLAADLRPSADGSAVHTHFWWPAVAKLQAASVPIA